MKRITLSIIALLAISATASAQYRTPSKTTSGNRPSTQKVGVSGSNGTGEGVVTHVFNGTGDGLKNFESKSYSDELIEKGLLPSKPGSHATHTTGPNPAAEGAPHGDTKAPSEAEADIKH